MSEAQPGPGSVVIEQTTLSDGSVVETRTTTLQDGSIEKTVTTFPPGVEPPRAFQNEDFEGGQSQKQSVPPGAAGAPPSVAVAPAGAPVKASTAVPVGHASVVAPGQQEPKSPKGMVIAIVVLDSIALLFWCISWAVPFIAIIGVISMFVGCILAFVLPCQTTDEIFKGKVKGVMIAHIVTIVLYIVAIILAVAAASVVTTAAATGTYTTQTATTTSGLAVGALITMIGTFIGLIVSLSLAGVLLCRVNGGDGCC